MTKTEMIKIVSVNVDLPQAKVKDVIDNVFDLIQKSDVPIVKGFGTFKRKIIRAHRGRNPQTGESIMIPEKNKLCFSSRS